MNRHAISIVVSCLLVTSCRTSDGDGPSWTPPPKEVVDTEHDSVVAGRLWVYPNPIRFRPEWGGDIGTSPSVGIHVENIGSEEVWVQDTWIEGSGEFYFGWEDLPPDEQPNRPVPHAGQPECRGGGAGMGFGLHYVPEGDALLEATLVVGTDDPTSPTVRVPIVFDTTGTLTWDDPMAHSPEEEAVIWVKPNPIRIAAGTASTTDLCVGIESCAEGCSLDRIRVHGEGLFLEDETDLVNPRISYVPETDGRMDGAFIVEFTNNWGDALSLVVPILVR